MNELLSCPFCGGEAETLTAESMHGGNLYGVMCANCAGRSDVYDTEAEAIAVWNSRAERTCHDDGDPSDFCCSECGARMFTDVEDTYTMIANDERTIIKRPNYCPNCGARVVDVF